MNTTLARSIRGSLGLVTVAALCMGCAEEAPLAVEQPDLLPQFALQGGAAQGMALATLRRATARYHDLEAAIADGFIQRTECEVLPDHGPAGLLYVNVGRVLDGVINLEKPDGLLYEPDADGRPTLVGVDLAVPFVLWTQPDPPELLGHVFQREDEFGAWALHVWIWRHNPDGMFAPANPRVTC